MTCAWCCVLKTRPSIDDPALSIGSADGSTISDVIAASASANARCR
jgi:hypothetical protein